VLYQVDKQWRSVVVDFVPILLHTFGISMAHEHGVAVHIQHSVGSSRCND
jgi:hypothetical protein